MQGIPLASQTIKIGQMILPAQAIFYERQYVYAMIPLVKLLPGHVLLVPRKQSLNYKDLEPGEIFDIALALKFLTKNLEKFHGCFASTIFVQNFNKGDDSINHVFLHVIPRRKDDLNNNDEIYGLLKDYDKDFLKQYNNTIAVHNAYSQTTAESLDMEARKHRDFLDKCVLEEQKINAEKAAQGNI